MRRSLILLSLLLFSVLGFSQVSSITSGDWTDPNTWSCGCVPDFNSGIIRIESSDTITISTTITADQLIISADAVLTIANGGKLILLDGALDDLIQEEADPPISTNNARVVVQLGGLIENRGQIAYIPTSLIFESGSEYQHNQSGNAIPEADWKVGSTCRITGWLGTTSGTPMTSFKSSLNQSFSHFIWDSPGQTAGNVVLSGSLTTVNGNLIINDTGSLTSAKILTIGFNSNVTGSIAITGNLVINFNGRCFLSSSGTYTANVGGNFILSANPLSVSPHYQIASAGIATLNVGGSLQLNSGQLNLTSSSGTGNINIDSNLELIGGTIAKPGTGTGNVTFTGAVNHTITKVSGTFSGGNLTAQSGTLNVSGNPLSLAGDITIANGATFNLPATISTAGNINFISGSTINSNSGTVTLTGSVSQSINANGATLNNLALNKGIAAITVSLTSPLSLSGELTISSSVIGTVFNAGTIPNNLTLLSTSDAATGNARIGSLSNGANVTGNVTVQRFMSPEARVYRYISSPVTNAPVSQLQDDFPVTGSFPQSSICTGCSTNPSLFYYDAATGAGAYVAYPAAATDPLVPGRGYAAFIRQDVVPMPLDPIIFDLSGPINQGPVSMPVFYNTVPDSSWNLVGNPYPSSIDWDDASWTKTNIATPIAVKDAGLGIFQYWNGTVGGITNGVIATGQGFWVRTTGSLPVLTIQEQAKSTTTGDFFRKSDSDFISMTITKGALYDKAYIQLREGAVLGLDDYDAPKLVNDNFDFYTQFVGSTPMAINAIENLSCQTEFLLDLRFTKNSSNAFVINPNGNYNLAFNIGGSEFDLYKITLKDQFTNSQQVVTSGFEYSFNVTTDPASFASGRLKLVVEAIQPKLDLNLESSDIVCKKGEANVIVKNSEKMFEYYLIGANDAISSTQSGTDGDLTFVVPDSLLNGGVNQIKVGVKGVCGVILLNKTVEVERVEDAAISLKAGDILTSNHKTGNQWYLNGELIPGAIDQEFKVMESGLYKVVATTGGCSSSAETNYIITGIESKGNGIIEIYPNPFIGEIHLISNSSIDLSTISVMNNLGQSVCERSSISQNEKGEINIKLNNLPDGLYFVRVTTANTVQTIKVIKDSRTR